MDAGRRLRWAWQRFGPAAIAVWRVNLQPRGHIDRIRLARYLRHSRRGEKWLQTYLQQRQ